VTRRGPEEGFWYLEGGGGAGRPLWRKELRRLPLLVGRSVNADIRLRATSISSRHAEIFERDGRPWLRDLGSTNGTYVNFSPLRGEAALQRDDIVHFSGLEFRIGFVEEPSGTAGDGTVPLAQVRLSADLAVASGRFRQLLESRGVRPYLQPIVHLHDREVLGVELLSKAEFDGRLIDPGELFQIAEFVGREHELSELCRERGGEAVQSGSPSLAPTIDKLFVNTHPRELEFGDRLLDSLAALSRVMTGSQIVVEIHEASITDRRQIRELHAALRGFGAQLAFDDFGTGHSRLIEIADAPPDYLKFDVQFVRRLDSASDSRRSMVKHLVHMTQEMGVTPIAEGVETEAELEACSDAGFDHAQGFLLGRPAPIDEFVSEGVILH